MMRKEIDILLGAASRDYAVVEKRSNTLWTWEALLTARDCGLYQGEDVFLPALDPSEGSSYYSSGAQPGVAVCSLHSRVLGQTRHFLIFDQPGDGDATPWDNQEPGSR